MKGFINGIPMESVKDGERSRAISKTSTVDHARSGLRKKSKKKTRRSEQDEEEEISEEETPEVQVQVQIEEVE